MASPRPGRHPHSVRTALRCASRSTAVLLGLALIGAGSPALAAPAKAAPPATAAPQAAAEPPAASTAATASFTIRGRGFGHGWGMSQYGAYGAARQGLKWQQIMGFYYPGTKVATTPYREPIRVKISADTDGDLQVAAAAGLAVTDSAGTRFVLPTGKSYAGWRVVRSGSSFALQTRAAGKSYRAYRAPVKLKGTQWTFRSNANLITIVLPGSVRKQVRGTVAAVAYRATMRTVNRLTLEAYLRSVVPLEMPTSWSAEAVRAQAVAARSYALRTKARAGTDAIYDICDTTTCQVYQGYARITSAGTRVNETRGGDAAIAATRRQVLSYRGTIAFTQFASSNGGASATGDFPYLKAWKDPYDGVVTSQAWSKTISAASLARVYPSVGTVKALKVTKRDGSGAWGGRVQKITVVGSKKSVTVSGTSFQYAYGMRSNLFAVS